jgi:hypothetical protein
MKNKSFNVPILFIIFRRKDAALQVIDAISKVKPKKLYISQDGPRNKKEEAEVVETRETVLSKINWKCDLTVWTHDKNLGLKKHIPEALNKFFKKEKMGIYLEDDTLPSKEFFYFEEELLEKYKDDKNIFSISGTNFYPRLVNSKDSYYLSKIGDIWGFGLWRRSWKLYNSEMNDLDKVSKTQEYKNYFFSPQYRFYLETFWKAIKSGKLKSWAMQLVYAAVKNNMYFITPSVNLVNNIGVNKKASNASLQSYYQDYGNPFPIKHLNKLKYHREYDVDYFKKMLSGGWLRLILIKIYLFLSIDIK